MRLSYDLLLPGFHPFLHLWRGASNKTCWPLYYKQQNCHYPDINIKLLAQAALRAPPEVALQCVAGHYYHILSFFSSFFSSFFPSFAFDPLRGISHVRNNFSFFKKKRWFFGRFSDFYGQRSVTAAWATRSPWSIFLLFFFLLQLFILFRSLFL